MTSPPALSIPSASEQRTRFAPVYAILTQAIASRVFPGCTFGVLESLPGGRTSIAALDGLGKQTYDRASPEVARGTVYDLASVTKVVVTTAMAMLLYQSERLDLDQSIVSLLPGFQNGQPGRGQVTLRHLLAHNSGLAGYARLFASHATRDSLLEASLQMPLEAMPGVRVEYSDIGFILLGRALERLAGESLDKFCKREIFTPLGMLKSEFNPPAERRALIPPTEDDQTFRHRVIQGEVQDENCCVLGGISGHAGLFGDALDLLRFSRSMLAPGLFQAATIRLFSARVGQPAKSSRALGWDTPSRPSSSGEQFSTCSIGHLGYSGTSLWIDQQAGCAVVLLTNRTWPSRENQQIKGLRPIFHDAVRKSLLREPDCA